MRNYGALAVSLIKIYLIKLKYWKRLKLYSFRYFLGKNAYIKLWGHGSCQLGDKTWLSANCRIEADNGEIVIGQNNFFNTNCQVVSLGKIIIGNNNLFGPNVIAVDHNHKFDELSIPICRQGYTIAPIHIGDGNWFGANVVITAGVQIGNHIVVGANSVVIKDLKCPGVYAGAPARLIKKHGDLE